MFWWHTHSSPRRDRLPALLSPTWFWMFDFKEVIWVFEVKMKNTEFFPLQFLKKIPFKIIVNCTSAYAFNTSLTLFPFLSLHSYVGFDNLWDTINTKMLTNISETYFGKSSSPNCPFSITYMSTFSYFLLVIISPT